MNTILATAHPCGTLCHIMAKTNTFRFRCDDEFKARLAAVAKLERRDPSDLARVILEDYIADQENRLAGKLHDRPAPASPAVPINRPVNYRGKLK